MDFVASFFTVLFVGLLLFVAFTLGFFLLTWVMAATIVFMLFLMIREAFRRWRFLRDAEPRNTIIEVEYRDISEE